MLSIYKLPNRNIIKCGQTKITLYGVLS